jgi:hypothetical protein
MVIAIIGVIRVMVITIFGVMLLELRNKPANAQHISKQLISIIGVIRVIRIIRVSRIIPFLS